MSDYSEQKALNLAVGYDGTHVIQAGQTWAPADKKILAIVPNESTTFTAILDPNGVDVKGAGDDNLNVAGVSLGQGGLLTPAYYTGGAKEGKFWSSVTVNIGSVLVYYAQEKV